MLRLQPAWRNRGKDSPWAQRRSSPSAQWPRPRQLKHRSSPKHRRRAATPCIPCGKHTIHTSQSRISSIMFDYTSVGGYRVGPNQECASLCECVCQKRREIPQVCEKKKKTSPPRTHHIVNSQCTSTMACDRGEKTSVKKKYFPWCLRQFSLRLEH